jgi:hypothetical protein
LGKINKQQHFKISRAFDKEVKFCDENATIAKMPMQSSLATCVALAAKKDNL